MAEQVTLKKKLLQEISGGLQVLRHSSARSSKSTAKSPRRSRWSRSSSKKSTSFKKSFLSFQPFHHTKEPVQLSPVKGSKTDSLKENAVRSASNADNHPGKSSKKHASKTLASNDQNKTATKHSSRKAKALSHKSLQHKSSNTIVKQDKHLPNGDVRLSTKPVVEVYHNGDANDPVLVVSFTGEQKELTETSTTSSKPCETVDKKKEIKPEKPHTRFAASIEVRQTNEANTIPTLMPSILDKATRKVSKSPKSTSRRPYQRLQRSYSDPTATPHESRVLYQQKQRVSHAKVTKTHSFKKTGRPRHHSMDSQEPEKTGPDAWKQEMRHPDEDTNFKFQNSVKFRNSCIGECYPLLKTRIPEEHVKEDGSITLRGLEKSDVNRDSGVEVDNITSRTVLFNNSTDESEADSRDSVFESSNDEETNFGTLKLRKGKEKTTDDNPSVIDDSTLTRNSRKSRDIEEESKWDMYALLKKFESVEWDLTPATLLKQQTLDLDDCELDAVPAAVTEIEYYAFRDVEAVSLNNNNKIENADILGKLTDLRIINMWGCSLKTIPQSWSALTKLQMLGLGGNRDLTYFSPLKHMCNLVWLDLGGCGLTKLPDEVTNMMKLRVLALGGNPGIEIGDEICSLWDLKQLGLNDCALDCIPKAVFSLIKLTHLHLDNNYICQISQEIVQLTELEELTVTGNSNVSFPKILSQCDTIKCIVVDQNKNLSRISGTLKSRMKQMPTAIATNTTDKAEPDT